jgi:hypothetical protein
MWLTKQTNTPEPLFVPLWLAMAFLLWYIGFAVWLSLIIGAIVSWLIIGLREQLRRVVSLYDIDIKPFQGIDDWPVEFTQNWRKRLLAIALPTKHETLKAEIRYIYQDGDSWPIQGEWKETSSPVLVVEDCGTYHLTVLHIGELGMETLDGKPLPASLKVKVTLKYMNNTIRKEFVQPLAID